MREIKFRAWDEEDKWMGEVTTIDFDENFCYIKTRHVEDENQFDMNGTPIMQYTGLKDKNGKEIYEGDILKITCKFELRKGIEIDVVEWVDSCISFGCSDWLLYELASNHEDGEQEFEVIGNIYENPELLEESQNESK